MSNEKPMPEGMADIMAEMCPPIPMRGYVSEEQAGVELSDGHKVAVVGRAIAIAAGRNTPELSNALFLSVYEAVIAADRQQRGKVEPVAAWINLPVRTDAVGNFTSYGEPELSFSRWAGGYDYGKAVPLYRHPVPQAEKAPSVQAVGPTASKGDALSEAFRIVETLFANYDLDGLDYYIACLPIETPNIVLIGIARATARARDKLKCWNNLIQRIQVKMKREHIEADVIAHKLRGLLPQVDKGRTKEQVDSDLQHARDTGLISNPLYPYWESYRTMAYTGDGKVDCLSIAMDIEKNMAKLVKEAAQKAETRFLNLEQDIRRVIGWEKPICEFEVVGELQAYIEGLGKPQQDSAAAELWRALINLPGAQRRIWNHVLDDQSRGHFNSLEKALMGCKVPPPGWYCTRPKGHEGPCAAHEVKT